LGEPSKYGTLCHELAHIYLGHLGADRDHWWTFVFLMLVVGEIWMIGIDRAKHDREQADARAEQLRRF
jgi:hypothetical protein